ncbi:MAG TPA: hypothetical protein VN758_10345 [Solirubrobacterales bacterium]|nr:hypothetical protein [Solirubrobacterales bacterium]
MEQDDHDEDDKAYWKKAGGQYWDDNLGGSVGHHIDPSITAADLAELREGSEKVRRYVDKHVAHFDASVIGRGPPPAPKKSGSELPTLNEVHDAIDLVGTLFKKYSQLFTAADIIELTPVLQHDWKTVFRVQWLPNLELPEPVRLAIEEQEKRKTESGDSD